MNEPASGLTIGPGQAGVDQQHDVDRRALELGLVDTQPRLVVQDVEVPSFQTANRLAGLLIDDRHDQLGLLRGGSRDEQRAGCRQ